MKGAGVDTNTTTTPAFAFLLGTTRGFRLVAGGVTEVTTSGAVTRHRCTAILLPHEVRLEHGGYRYVAIGIDTNKRGGGGGRGA